MCMLFAWSHRQTIPHEGIVWTIKNTCEIFFFLLQIQLNNFLGPQGHTLISFYVILLNGQLVFTVGGGGAKGL